MDAISIIMAALIAGATAGLSQGTGTVLNKAIEESYAALKKMLSDKSSKPEVTKRLLDEHESDQQAWKDQLRDNIIMYNLDKSEEIVKVSEKLLLLLVEIQSKTQKTDLTRLVGQLNAYGGKVIIVGGNVNRIDM